MHFLIKYQINFQYPNVYCFDDFAYIILLYLLHIAFILQKLVPKQECTELGSLHAYHQINTRNVLTAQAGPLFFVHCFRVSEICNPRFYRLRPFDVFYISITFKTGAFLVKRATTKCLYMHFV